MQVALASCGGTRNLTTFLRTQRRAFAKTRAINNHILPILYGKTNFMRNQHWNQKFAAQCKAIYQVKNVIPKPGLAHQNGFFHLLCSSS